MKMRRHQIEMDEIAGQINAKLRDKKTIVLDCTPGGGKTGSATLLANRLLDEGTIDSVLWVVPRNSLADQVIEGFEKGPGSKEGCARVLTLANAETNLFAKTMLGPDVVGHVTTYQQLVSPSASGTPAWKRFKDAIAARRTLLILDEVQFLRMTQAAEDGPDAEPDDPELPSDSKWYRRTSDIAKDAALTLVMSGTLWRTDDEPIPFIEYERGDGSEGRPTHLLFPKADIHYTLRDAIGEKAVIPIEWVKLSGTVEYSYEGFYRRFDMASEDMEPEAVEEGTKIVRTILSGWEAVRQILDEMVKHWKAQRERVNYGRMIVMAPDAAAAKRYARYLTETHDINCIVATIREERSGNKLSQFRKREKGQCLVTVAMAYVGFDCPDLTHLAYLSTIRAPSWMLQSFARISRRDRQTTLDYEQQRGFVFAPDDPLFRRFNCWLREEQLMGIQLSTGRRQEKPEGDGGGYGEPKIEIRDGLQPLDVNLSGKAVESMSVRLAPATVARLEAFQAACPSARGLALSQLYEILRHAPAGLEDVQEGAHAGP
jgi:superfamily II DNA or RNA helicase